MLSLSNLKISRKSKSERIVVGRGNASGKGSFSGRGIKGQRSRTGGSNKLLRLGMRHIILQSPKLRGFKSLQAKPVAINLGDLEKNFTAGDRIGPKELRAKGLLDNLNFPVKILGEGSLTKAFTFAGCMFSSSALEKIKKAGGKIESTSKYVRKD